MTFDKHLLCIILELYKYIIQTFKIYLTYAKITIIIVTKNLGCVYMKKYGNVLQHQNLIALTVITRKIAICGRRPVRVPVTYLTLLT